jgi:HEAT repeat protein
MRTRQVDKGTRGRMAKQGWIGGRGRTGGMVKTLLVVTALVVTSLPASPAPPASLARRVFPAGPASPAQVSFEQATTDLASADAGTRMKAVQLLKTAAFPEAAVPLAAVLTDPQDDIQLEAIAAELNIFLADPIVPRKRVAFVIEKRSAVQAEAAFSAGPNALGAQAVPPQVLTALRTAARDENPRVGIEALYGFGTLAVQPGGAARRELLRAAGPDIAAFIGSSDPAMRYAAVRVIGRVFAWRREDAVIESTVGDAVITAMNDGDRAVRTSAMQALGAMRYERGVQALTDLFNYFKKGDAAEAAFDALAHIGHATSIPLFAAQLSSKSAALRGSAIEGLARSGDRSQLPAIQAIVDKEHDRGVSLAGAFAAVLLGNGSVDPVADALVRANLREQAKRYVIEIAPGRTALFTHQLLDSDPQIRLDVVDALGLAGDPAAIAAVEPLTSDKDPDVARAAERAVARLKR